MSHVLQHIHAGKTASAGKKQHRTVPKMGQMQLSWKLCARSDLGSSQVWLLGKPHCGCFDWHAKQKLPASNCQPC